MLNSFGPFIAKIKNPPAKATFFKKLVKVIGSAKSRRKIKAVAKQNNPSAIEDNLTWYPIINKIGATSSNKIAG